MEKLQNNFCPIRLHIYVYCVAVGRFTFPCLPYLPLPYLASICTYLVYVQGKVFLPVEMPSLGYYIFVIPALNNSAGINSNFLRNWKKIIWLGLEIFLFVFLLNKFGTSVIPGFIFSSLQANKKISIGPKFKKVQTKNSWNQIQNQFHEYFFHVIPFLPFQKRPKINFWTGKKFKTAKNAISRNWFIWFHEFFCLDF